MARSKWNANAKAAGDDRSLLRRYRLLLGIAVLLAIAGGYMYHRYINSDLYRYGLNATETQRAISDCVDDHTRVANDDDATDHAGAACVNGADADKDHEKTGDQPGL